LHSDRVACGYGLDIESWERDAGNVMSDDAKRSYITTNDDKNMVRDEACEESCAYAVELLLCGGKLFQEWLLLPPAGSPKHKSC
jgi:hypothetical protein